MTRPSVSVLTPSFNQAPWLQDNLHSVACQDYPVEHVVMDGGSSDGSVELLRQAGDVIWESSPDRGQSHALNRAFERSSGEIIGWLNSDDAFYDCGVVRAVATVFGSDRTIDVVYGHSAYVNETGLILHYTWTPKFSAKWLRRYNYLIQPAVFVRRSALADGLVDEVFNFAMDYELWLRLAAAGRRFERIDRVLAIDRAQALRKSKTMLDVRDQNMELLRSRYGVDDQGVNRAMGAAHAVALRFAGARLVFRTGQVDRLAFSARSDGVWPTLRRQCLTRRRSMEAG